MYGISSVSSPFSNIRCNQVFGSGAATGQPVTLLPRGLRVQDSDRSKFSCNYFSNIFIGASFSNGCYSDSIRGNSFNNHRFGLYYNKYCITGPQKHQGNMWNGNFVIGAKHDYDSGNLVNVYQNLYRVKLGGNFVPPSWDPGIWFLPGPDTATYTCSNCPPPDSIPPSDSLAGSIDFAIAQGLNLSEDFQSETKWATSRYLYDKLIRDSSLIFSSPILENFYDTIQYASAAKFENVDNGAKAALYLAPVNKSLIDTMSRQIKSTLQLISVKDSLLRNITNSSDSLALSGQRDSLFTVLEYLNAQLRAIMQGVNNLHQSNINLVITENGLLPSAEIFEQNEKSVNEIYLNTIAKGILSFSLTQISIIEEIANQCPLAGGQAVYLARSMYRLIKDTVYDDVLLCYAAGIKNKPIDEPVIPDNKQFKIFPNPATDIVNVSWDNPCDEFAVIEFITPLGQVYYSQRFSLSESGLFISLKNWKPGIYQVCIKHSDKKVRYDKLIITD